MLVSSVMRWLKFNEPNSILVFVWAKLVLADIVFKVSSSFSIPNSLLKESMRFFALVTHVSNWGNFDRDLNSVYVNVLKNKLMNMGGLTLDLYFSYTLDSFVAFYSRYDSQYSFLNIDWNEKMSKDSIK